MPSTSLIAHSLILALAPLVARADLGIPDDISANCQSICRPVWQLGQACDVDDDLIRNKPTEDALNAQCYCLNNSFDVRSITGLCASCIQQNPAIDGDDQFPEYDDAREVNEIMFRCGFQSTSYAAAQNTLANSIVVSAVRPTNAAQLTTTIAGGVGGVAPPPTGVPTAPITSLQTVTYTTNFGQGLTTGTATVRATAPAQTAGTGTGLGSGAATAGASEMSALGWKTVLGYTVGVAAVAAWFF